MKALMHALAASCEELRARTGNPPSDRLNFMFLVHCDISGRQLSPPQSLLKYLQITYMKFPE
jgi:hypothetical protein